MDELTKRKPIALSIDFDFFSYEDPLWDWGHSEAPLFQEELVWTFRILGGTSVGIDFVKETSLEKADVHPLKVFETLQDLGWTIDEDCKLTISDSHVYAAPAFLSLPDCRIVNLDAHHDLGYLDTKKMKSCWKSQRCRCDDWLWFLLKVNPQFEAVQVYPSWKDHTYDWPDDPHWVGTSIEKRVCLAQYSQEMMKALAGNVVAIHIARSSAWVPPWHDHVVVALLDQLLLDPGLAPSDMEGSYDIRNPRVFDLDAVIEAARHRRKLAKPQR
jgi:hypothetical protein